MTCECLKNSRPKSDAPNPLSSYKFHVFDLLKPNPELPLLPPRRTWATPTELSFILEKPVNDAPLPEPFKWTNLDVILWIDGLGYPEYRNTFMENIINGRTLLLVDASALCQMNIKNFDHMIKIARAIRNLYQVENILFKRSISLPPRYPDTHYKIYKVYTGPKYELATRTDLWRKMKLMKERTIDLNHFEQLTEWLKHIPRRKEILVGGIKRINLYYVKPGKNYVKVEPPHPLCPCIPPCECKWPDEAYLPPWHFECLVRRHIIEPAGPVEPIKWMCISDDEVKIQCP